MQKYDIICTNCKGGCMEENRLTIPQIESFADTVLKKFGQEDNPKVEVITIANQLGFEVFLHPFKDDIAGKVVQNKDSKIIYINESDAPTRKRFTIAHEIGHILLHHTKNDNIEYMDHRGKGDYDQREFEADNFAASLLMPKEISMKVWRNTKDIDDFADVMQVSKVAASIRLRNLGLIY